MSQYQHEPPVSAVPHGTAILMVMAWQWAQAAALEATEAEALAAAVAALRPDPARHTFVRVSLSCPDQYRAHWARAAEALAHWRPSASATAGAQASEAGASAAGRSGAA